MGETIDLNDLFIEESFINVKMFMGAINEDRVFTKGDKVLYKDGETYTFERYEGDEAVLLGDDSQEKKVNLI